MFNSIDLRGFDVYFEETLRVKEVIQLPDSKGIVIREKLIILEKRLRVNVSESTAKIFAENLVSEGYVNVKIIPV